MSFDFDAVQLFLNQPKRIDWPTPIPPLAKQHNIFVLALYRATHVVVFDLPAAPPVSWSSVVRTAPRWVWQSAAASCWPGCVLATHRRLCRPRLWFGRSLFSRSSSRVLPVRVLRCSLWPPWRIEHVVVLCSGRGVRKECQHFLKILSIQILI